MMLSSVETPRPLPPAKARRMASAQRLRGPSTPPPAYGSPFSFPGPGNLPDVNTLDSDVNNEWQEQGQCHDLGDGSLSWLDEKSREELSDLLVKADDIIKERENELDATSTICKSLYERNAALRSKHEALLARLPSTPSRSVSTPNSTRSDPIMPISHSSSDSDIGHLQPEQPSFPTHARKVSMSMADVSYLADQNADLLQKLEKLETEAVSADQAGRRELRRLEKEIIFLREALEKTQAKSEELEEKVQDAVTGEASRKRAERDAKIRAMRKLGRASTGNEEGAAPNFAPAGHKLGVPSRASSFSPSSPSSSTSSPLLSSTSNGSPTLPTAENPLIAQLLTKVKELEEANARIVQQQADTTQQLTAVQRDAENMSKVYECLVDPATTHLELEADDEEPVSADASEPPLHHTIKFRNLRRNLETGTIQDNTRVIHREVPQPNNYNQHRSRKSVMGLFDEPPQGSTTSRPPLVTIDAGTPLRKEKLSKTSIPESEPLSPLEFFSGLPPSSPDAPPRGLTTLQSELAQRFDGNEWEDMNVEASPRLHTRNSSLFDMGQYSIPNSPSPASRSERQMLSEELGLTDSPMSSNRHNYKPHPPSSPPSSRQAHNLSVGRARGMMSPYSPHYIDPASMSPSQMPKSPRMQQMMETFRSRHQQWNHRRFAVDNGYSSSLSRSKSYSSLRASTSGGAGDRRMVQRHKGKKATPALSRFKKRLSNALDNMMDTWETTATAVTGEDSEDDLLASSDDGDDDEKFEDAHAELPSTPPPPSAKSLPGDKTSNNKNALQVRTPQQSPEKEKENRSTSSIILEIWLWIQLALIVFVFVWNVAKRGPRNVLGEAERNAVSRRK